MIRVAVCGLGNIGKVHLQSLLTLRGCVVAGICDPFAAGTPRLAAENGVPLFENLTRVLEDVTVDAVIIATPSQLHREMTERALNAGKHVFLEKPLAGTLEDCQAILDAARRRPDRVVQVGFCERFNSHFIEARRAVTTGRLGKVRCIHSSRVAPLALGNPNWELGILDTATHNLDLALWLNEEMPLRVLARGVQIYPESGIPHSAMVVLEFRGGALATDSITWLADKSHPLHQCARARMQIIGERGAFEVDLSHRPAALLTDEQYSEIDTVLLGGDGYYGCLKLQFECFLRSIQEGVPVLAPCADAYRVELVVSAAQRSMLSNDWVALA